MNVPLPKSYENKIKLKHLIRIHLFENIRSISNISEAGNS